MRKIIPFHKEIVFRTMIGEITSISLEHDLHFTDPYTIEGNFIVSGTYKMTEASQIEEEFFYEIPAVVTVDDKYDTTASTIAIDNFTYEVASEEVLKVHIDLALDGMEEVEVLTEEAVLDREDDDFLEDQPVVVEELPVREVEKASTEVVDAREEEVQVASVEEESTPVLETISTVPEDPFGEISSTKEDAQTTQEEATPSIDSIFSALKDTEETFSTYYVYIVRETDTLDSILEKYQTTREDLGNYNKLDEIKVGMKLIIPTKITK